MVSVFALLHRHRTAVKAPSVVVQISCCALWHDSYFMSMESEKTCTTCRVLDTFEAASPSIIFTFALHFQKMTGSERSCDAWWTHCWSGVKTIMRHVCKVTDFPPVALNAVIPQKSLWAGLVLGLLSGTLLEKKVPKCTFKGTTACHWGGTLKGTAIVPSTVGTYLYPCHLYLIKTRTVIKINQVFLCQCEFYLFFIYLSIYLLLNNTQS